MTASRQLKVLRWMLRHFEKPMLARAKTPGWTRIRSEIGARAILRGRKPWSFKTVEVAGLPTRQLEGGEGTLLYLHGGAYILMSARTHQGLAAKLAGELGLTAIVPEYTRAPECTMPGPLDEVTRVYEALAARPGPLVIAGDSAGGGLSLALLQRILSRGLRVPDAVLAFSPWTDLSLSGESLTTNAESDPFLPASNIAYVRDMVLGDHDATDPDVSPLFADFTGAPPVLIQAISDEILLSDAKRMAVKMQADGVPVTLEVLPHGVHAFQIFLGHVPEADEAVDAAVRFANAALG